MCRLLAAGDRSFDGGNPRGEPVAPTRRRSSPKWLWIPNEDKTLAELAKHFELYPTHIVAWKQQLLEHAAEAVRRPCAGSLPPSQSKARSSRPHPCPTERAPQFDSKEVQRSWRAQQVNATGRLPTPDLNGN